MDERAVRPRSKVVALAVLLLFPAPAFAAHVLGLGNYEYEPGAVRPSLRLAESVDGWRIEVTGFPGDPAPGEEVTFLVNMTHASSGRIHIGAVECTIDRVNLVGQRRRIVDADRAEFIGVGHRFTVALPEDSEYVVRFAFRDPETGISSLSIPIVVGRPGSPMAILAGFGGGIGLFIITVACIGVRRRRIRGTAP